MTMLMFYHNTAEHPEHQDLFLDEIIVITIGFILLSGYSMILWISPKVDALSSAYILPFGRPRVIFFHGMTMSVTSQNILIVLT
jgi:hypothetical protein